MYENFSWKNEGKRLERRRRIPLNEHYRHTYGMKEGTGFNWLRIGSSGGVL
jgi:hypothetical protein